MRKLITINRQFGSGGREVGKRLADELQIAYYDKELISKISNETGLCDDYISQYEETAISRYYPFTFGRTFAFEYSVPQNTIYIAQTKVIKKLAHMQDCVIIGRCANYILGDEAFKVLIYSSDMDKRIDRCYDKVPADRDKSRDEMKKMINSVDKKRARYYDFYAGEKWLDINNYNLCIDTAKISIQDAVKLIAEAIENCEE